MTLLGKFIVDVGALFLATLLCKTIVNYVCVKETFFLTKRDVKMVNLICGLFLMSFIEIAPIFIAALFFFPNNTMNPAVYTLLSMPSPIIIVLYYPIYRYVFKASAGMTAIMMEWLLMAKYLAFIVYSFFNEIGIWLCADNQYWRTVNLPDLFALICAAVIALATYFIFIIRIKRSQHYIVLPHDYKHAKILRKMFDTYLGSASAYVMIVAVRLILLRDWQYMDDASVLTIAGYVLLMVLQLHKLFSQYYKNRHAALEWHAKETEEYISSLLQVTREFGLIKHDFYNILQTYEGYMAVSDMESLRKYHRSLTNTTVATGNNLDMIKALRDRMPVHTLLVIKKHMAEEAGVLFNIIQAGALVSVDMSDLDLCRVLSNLIDNAIQGAAVSDAKWIQMFCMANGGDITVNISNSTNDDIDINKIFCLGYTTKSEHPGLGLCSVKDILKSHRGCSLSAKCENNQFNVNLLLAAQA